MAPYRYLYKSKEVHFGKSQLGYRPAYFPTEQHYKLNNPYGDILDNLSSCRRLTGRLNYLTICRPHINFALNILSQFMHNPLRASSLCHLLLAPLFEDHSWL